MRDPGYSITENVFSDRECDQLLCALADDRLDRGRAGARHLMTNPAVRAVANDSRLLAIARSAMGHDVIPYRATLFEKSKQANWLVVWHQDTALPLSSHNNSSEWGPWSRKARVIYAHAPSWALSRTIALRIHLDPSTAANGPLKVIPGSHEAGVLSDEQVFAIARREQSVECSVPRGGVLTMCPLLIHSSSKMTVNKPRRVLHIEFAESLDLSEDVRLAIA